MRTQQPPEKSLGRGSIAFSLQIDIKDFTILTDCSPQAMLLATDPHEDFIEEASIAVTSVFTLQEPGELGAELDAAEPDGFVLAVMPCSARKSSTFRWLRLNKSRAGQHRK